MMDRVKKYRLEDHGKKKMGRKLRCQPREIYLEYG